MNIFTRSNLPLFSGLTALTIALTGGAVVYTSAHKTISLDVEGEVRTISTFAGSVENLLDAEGVAVSARDLVTPDVTARLVDGADVVVRYGKQVTVLSDGSEKSAWVTALDAGEALAALSARGTEVALVASRSAGRPDLGLRLGTTGPVAVLADGQTQFVTGAGETVDTALQAAGLSLGIQDRVRVVTASKVEGAVANGAQVAVVVERVLTTEEITEIVLPFETERQNDDSRYVGTEEVIQAGAEGLRVRTERVVTVDGVEVSRRLLSEDEMAAAVNEIIAVGTKAKPAPVAPRPSAPAGGGATGVAPDGVWGALARCESGGNPGIVSSNGLYHGLYQFTVSTWQSVGGSGLPSQASAEEQTMRAQLLQQRSGWGQWPACARSLGLY